MDEPSVASFATKASPLPLGPAPPYAGCAKPVVIREVSGLGLAGYVNSGAVHSYGLWEVILRSAENRDEDYSPRRAELNHIAIMVSARSKQGIGAPGKTLEVLATNHVRVSADVQGNTEAGLFSCGSPINTWQKRLRDR